MKKEAHFQILGMNQDLAYQLFDPKYAFETRNIRINTTDENSLVSLTNERGNALVATLQGEGSEEESQDTNVVILGIGSFSDYVIIFAHGDTYDYICSFDGTELNVLYKGHLNFQRNAPIRTVCVFENDEVQKVYWVDGVNMPRVINVAGDINTNSYSKKIERQHLNILPQLSFNERVSVKRTAGGSFPSGVVQYVITYSDKNLQESNIWYVSPLYYSSLPNRGADAETTCNVAFELSFTNLDKSFDYMQIYVLVRSSLNAQPACYRIANVSTSVNSFTDNGSQWESFPAATLITKQLNTFVPKIISSKDSTLFLGNYTMQSPKITKSDYSSFFSSLASNTVLQWISSSINEAEGAFNLDKDNRSLQTFRDDEYYRVGVQFQDEYGTPSSVLYLKDIHPDIANSPSDRFMQKVIGCTIPSVPSTLKDKFKRMRLVMVDRSNLPHRSICQGLLCPTVYRVNDRVNNSPFSMSSWCMRATNPTNDKSKPVWEPDMPLHSNKAVGGGELENQLDYTGVSTNSGGEVSDSTILINTNSQSSTSPTYYYLCRIIATQNKGDSLAWPARIHIEVRLGRTTNPEVTKVSDCEERFMNPYRNSVSNFGVTSIETCNAQAKAWCQQLILETLQSNGAAHPSRIVSDLFANWQGSKNFVQRMEDNRSLVSDGLLVGDGSSYKKVSDYIYQSFDDAVTLAKSIGQPFFCDHNILTFHSPDVEKYQMVLDNNPNIKYRIVGYTNMTKSYFSTFLKTSSPKSKDSMSGTQTVIKTSKCGLYNASLWKDGDLYQTYLWHRDILGDQQNATAEGVWYGKVERKIFANVHFCEGSYAFLDSGGNAKVFNPTTDLADSVLFPKMGTPRVFNSNEVSALSVEAQRDSNCIHTKLIYYGNVEIFHSTGTYSIPIMGSDGKITDKYETLSSDPILMKYKSTPHVVMPMSFYSFVNKYFAPALPYPKSAPMNGQGNNHGYLWVNKVHGFGRSGLSDLHDSVNKDDLIYIAELYQDISAADIYGNTDDESLSKLSWVPISDWVALEDNKVLTGYGDTFIGRWDCLKTYASSEDDIQSYVDITSVILESDINLEGRCDSLKGIHDAVVVNNTNFNKFNPVYDQPDNFFMYRLLRDSELLDNFQNQICWSEVKTLGEELDQWCQINVGNNTDLQGEYGELRSIRNFGNNLYCFQDNAVYKLNYNTRVAISPTDGVPIELSNNYKVDPPLLLKQFCGVTSQDATVTTDKALYFFDANRARIFSLSANDQILDLSTEKGMNSLLSKSTGFTTTLFDSSCKDTYFGFGGYSLGFNEDLMEFTSLYDYDRATHLFTIQGDSYMVVGNTLWKQRSGRYNEFFGTFKPFYVQVLANGDPLISKTFTNLEYTMVGDNDEAMSNAKDEGGHLLPLDSFDSIKVETSYQENTSSLEALRAKPSNLKRKFRVWRVDIPRDNGSLDRMRDMWMKVKLTKSKTNYNRYRINNINISYLDS